MRMGIGIGIGMGWDRNWIAESAAQGRSGGAFNCPRMGAPFFFQETVGSSEELHL